MPRKASEKGLAIDKLGQSGGTMIKYDAKLALRMCERVSEGGLITEICQEPWAPSTQTFYRWLTVYPDFRRAYDRARTLSAEAFEDEALMLARELKGKHNFTGTRVRAYEVAMNQFRWSASHRDPNKYGSKMEGKLIVPVQINTTVDLGDDANYKASTKENTYTFAAEVHRELPPDTTPEDKVELLDKDDPMGVPKEARNALKQVRGAKRIFAPNLGAQRKHKTQAGTAVTKAAHRRRIKNATVPPTE